MQHHQSTRKVQPNTNHDIPDSVKVTIIKVRSEWYTLDVHEGEGESTWLPNIGPTAMVLARRLLADGGGVYRVADLAHGLGVGQPRLWEALRRLRRAQLLTFESPTDISLRAHWPLPKGARS